MRVFSVVVLFALFCWVCAAFGTRLYTLGHVLVALFPLIYFSFTYPKKKKMSHLQIAIKAFNLLECNQTSLKVKTERLPKLFI